MIKGPPVTAFDNPRTCATPSSFTESASRRSPFDVLAVLPFLFAVVQRVYRTHFGFIPLRDPLWIRPVDWVIFGGFLLVPLLFAGITQWISDRKAGEVEERLRGYLGEELV